MTCVITFMLVAVGAQRREGIARQVFWGLPGVVGGEVSLAETRWIGRYLGRVKGRVKPRALGS